MTAVTHFSIQKCCDIGIVGADKRFNFVQQVGIGRVNPINPPQLRELVDAYGAALVLYARQWCSCPDDALQEALIDLSQQASAPRDPAGWLFKAVRYKAINFARADQRRSRHWRQAAVERDTWFDCDPTTTLQSEELETMLAELEPQVAPIHAFHASGMP